MRPDDPATAPARLAAARAEFSPELTYLNTASMGLPPRRSLDALDHTLTAWRSGHAQAADFDAPVAAARASYAGLVGVDPARVSVGPQVSVFAGVVAASLPDGAEVLTATGEFTSVVYPFLTQAGRGVRVRQVPLDEVPAAITDRTALVAVAAVQSADGRLIDLDALAAASTATGTRVLLDTTQAVGWLPVPAGRFTYTVCGGYKWLLAPRGTCFATVDPADDLLVAHNAGWYAADDPWTAIYADTLHQAPDARRFDVSPAWHSWVAQAASLTLLAEVGVQTLHAHAVGLADRFRAALELPAGRSAIVSIDAAPDAAQALRAAGVAVAVRAGRLRLAFHVHNDVDDVERAATVLRDQLRSTAPR